MPDLIVWKNQYINRLKRDMDRIFDRMWGEIGPTLVPRMTGITPFIDLTETDKSLILRAEIPGADPKDLDIDIDETVLTIRGETSQEIVGEDENRHRIERRYGSFYRTLKLPCRVILDDVKATYKKGILKITMPKCAPEETRKIKIKVK